MWVASRHRGFTIVELLIVIVVIGILAAITIVAYNGITQKANQASAQTAAEQAAKKVLSYMALNSDQVPVDLATAGVTANGNATYQYSSTSGSQQTFCLTATVSTASYYIDNQSHTTPTSGACAGHAPAGATLVINLATNPKLDNDTLGWYATGSVSGTSRAAITGLSGFTNAYQATVSAANDRLYLENNTGNLTNGQSYMASAWVKAPSGMQVYLQTTTYGGATTYANGSTVVGTGTWQRLSLGFTSTAVTWRVAVRLAAASSGTLQVTGVMLTSGTTLYNYADGATAGWAWTGTPGNSTSSGPAV